ncbi:MAG: DUF1194 domain-containing protein [Minwuiales bacterium]|nr:DUF1194 domain-containing protein [Minwuiales bacterium]
MSSSRISRRIFCTAFRAARLAAFLAGLLPAAAAAEQAVDLELVLAVDGSASVDADEYALQMRGIAAAFRDPDVVAALQSGPLGRIGVTLMTWSRTDRPKHAMPWRVLDSAESAAAFADAVLARPRVTPASGTGIGRAVQRAVWLIERNDMTAERRVIDVSGDGRETSFIDYGVPPQQARQQAMAHGITVNGLAILADEPDLDAYYRAHVIGGPGAFVMKAARFEDFAAAMRRKLIREIEYRPRVSQARPPAHAPAMSDGADR